MPTTKIDDIKVYYEDAGSGDALVFISGLAGTHKDWRLQAPFFSRHFRTVVFDNRGVGMTEKPRDGYSIGRFAEDAVRLMDHLKIERAHVVGLSMGGMIAQEMALSHPSRLKRLVLCATHCGANHAVKPPQESIDAITKIAGLTFEQIIRQSLPIVFTEPFMRDHPQEVEKYVQDKLNSPRQTFQSFNGQIQAAMEFDSYHRLHQIEHDTLVLTAQSDILVLPENSRILAEKIPRSRLIALPEGGHLLNIEAADKFNQTLLDFLLRTA